MDFRRRISARPEILEALLLWLHPLFHIDCFCGSASDTLARGHGDGHVPRGRGQHSRPLRRIFTAVPARVSCFLQGRGFMALWAHGPTPCPCPPCPPYPLPCPPCPPCISSCVSGQVPRARHCLPRTPSAAAIPSSDATVISASPPPPPPF